MALANHFAGHDDRWKSVRRYHQQGPVSSRACRLFSLSALGRGIKGEVNFIDCFGTWVFCKNPEWKPKGPG